MLGAGISGAWQLPGRISVVPAGQGCPGGTRVPPRMPGPLRQDNRSEDRGRRRGGDQ